MSSQSSSPSELEAALDHVSTAATSPRSLERLSIKDEVPFVDLDQRTSDTDPSSISTRQAELDLLKIQLYSKSDTRILRHCLGLEPLEGVSRIAKHMIVVCLDTENFERDQRNLTEIGVATFASVDMRKLSTPGTHGEDLMGQAYFYHARIKENAHLINNKFCVGRPDLNRFGQTRFLDKTEACEMLKGMFVWPSTDEQDGPPCPVVVVGHALSGDLLKLYDTLGFDAAQLGTVVKTIDTQQLARESGYALNPRDPIGLENLVGRCGFEYRDAHTAGNDGAMTLICAIQMILFESYSTGIKPQLQASIDAIEQASWREWEFGTDRYCTCCSSPRHFHEECSASVECRHCRSSCDKKRRNAARSHATERCNPFLFRRY